MDLDAAGLEVLPRDECVALLSSVPVGRVVFTDRALPAVLPVTFVIDGDGVVLRTSSTSRLVAAAAGSVIAFEADDVEPALRSGWSVTVTGQLGRVVEPVEVRRLGALLQARAPGRRECFLRLPMTLVSGRRIVPRPGRSTLQWVGPGPSSLA